jgi:four helix bundle protein
MQDYKKLTVWKKSYALALSIYKISGSFPKNELYGLVSQIRRAGTSIPANIAEGCGRESNSELIYFLQIAQGSAAELETHLMLSRDLGYCKDEEFSKIEDSIDNIRKMLTSLIRTIKTNNEQRKTKN